MVLRPSYEKLVAVLSLLSPTLCAVVYLLHSLLKQHSDSQPAVAVVKWADRKSP